MSQQQIDNGAKDAAREAVCGSEVSANPSDETTAGAKEKMIAELLSLVQGWMMGKDSSVIDKIEVSPDKISVSFKSKAPEGNDVSMLSLPQGGMFLGAAGYPVPQAGVFPGSAGYSVPQGSVFPGSAGYSMPQGGMSPGAAGCSVSQNSDAEPFVLTQADADFASEMMERKFGAPMMIHMRNNRAHRDQIVGQLRDSGYLQKEIDRWMGISQFDFEAGRSIVGRIVDLMKERDCNDESINLFIRMSKLPYIEDKFEKKEFTRELAVCMMWVCGCSQGQISKIFRVSQPWVSRMLSSNGELVEELRKLWCDLNGLMPLVPDKCE